MSEASRAAETAAESLGVDLSKVEGTGKDGLITRQDVLDAAESSTSQREAIANTNIMEKAKLEREKSQVKTNMPANSGAIELPSQEELVQIIRELQTEVTTLREGQADLAQQAAASADTTDNYFYIAQPNGHRWEERRVVDGRTMNIEFVATAFFGPFATEEDTQKYLATKRERREDSFLEWQNARVIRGREAKAIDAKETAEREKQFASSAPVNVLDRRIFAQQTDGNVPGMATLVEQRD